MILCFQIEKEEEFDNNNEGRKNDASSYKPTSGKCGVCNVLLSSHQYSKIRINAEDSTSDVTYNDVEKVFSSNSLSSFGQ